MKIIVCIKQVPFVDQLKFDYATKRLIRDGVQNEINPFDRRAIAQAVELRKQFGGEAIVITMGPPQAKDALIEALAMGADRAVHLLGKEMAGADTLATARTLAMACRKIGFDLILCGEYSTDAETAQVPPMLAEFLDVPQVTAVTRLELVDAGKHIRAVREMDDGFETVECAMPAVLSAAERLIRPGRATPADLESAKQRPIEVVSPTDMSTDMSLLGLAGSPTWVSEIYTIEPKRKQIIRRVDGNADAVVKEVVRDLLTEGLFGTWKSETHEVLKPRKRKKAREGKEEIWVVAEVIEGKLRPVTFELIGRSIQLADRIDALVSAVLIGHNVGAHAKSLAAHGADRVYIADSRTLASYTTDAYTTILANAIRQHDPYAVLIPSTANGRDLAPRVAARLKIGLTGDCIGLEIDDQKRLVQLKPAFGGNVVAPILTKTRPAMATVRPGMLHQAKPDFSRKPVIQKLPTQNLGAVRTRVVSVETNASAGVELDNAEIVVSVGMGLGGPENISRVQELASLLGAPIGATRRVVDAGWLPRQMQIGLTGRSISPRLYIAIGVSGMFNHVVGIQRAGLVLAINNNPDAGIFKQCDYGIVGDWAEVVTALTQALKGKRKR